MTIYDQSLEQHAKYKGKLAVASKVPLNSKEDLSVYYSPGVAQPCLEIAKDPAKAYDYTWKCNSVAVISDGTAVLGLGNI
jgi:malate dehydrogenase (oxaloacetate-decarboxylating)